MSFEKKQRKRESKNWWSEKRFEYNIGLLLSGSFAFFIYILFAEYIIYNNNSGFLDIEITVFSFFFQVIGYLIMMGFANIIFYGISGSELEYKTQNTSKLRINIYNSYYWFSCGLPFLIPIHLLIIYYF